MVEFMTLNLNPKLLNYTKLVNGAMPIGCRQNFNEPKVLFWYSETSLQWCRSQYFFWSCQVQLMMIKVSKRQKYDHKVQRVAVCIAYNSEVAFAPKQRRWRPTSLSSSYYHDHSSCAPFDPTMLSETDPRWQNIWAAPKLISDRFSYLNYNLKSKE